MFSVLKKKTRKLRRKNNVVRNVIKFLVAVHHLVRLAAVDVHAFKIKPLFLPGREWTNKKYVFVRLLMKCIAKQRIDHRQKKEVVRTCDFPIPEHLQNVGSCDCE